MHLVGVPLEPGEETFHAIPGLGPLESVFAVAGLAVDDEVALLGGELGEGDVDGNLFLFGDGDEVVFGGAVNFAFPGFDRAVGDGDGLVGDREAVVDLDDAAEAAALRAGAERGVEGEECGGRGAEGAAGFG